VQVIKGTALASVKLTKAGTMITNATFRPFTVYACVGAALLHAVFPDLCLEPLARKEAAP